MSSCTWNSFDTPAPNKDRVSRGGCTIDLICAFPHSQDIAHASLENEVSATFVGCARSSGHSVPRPGEVRMRALWILTKNTFEWWRWWIPLARAINLRQARGWWCDSWNLELARKGAVVEEVLTLPLTWGLWIWRGPWGLEHADAVFDTRNSRKRARLLTHGARGRGC